MARSCDASYDARRPQGEGSLQLRNGHLRRRLYLQSGVFGLRCHFVISAGNFKFQSDRAEGNLSQTRGTFRGWALRRADEVSLVWRPSRKCIITCFVPSLCACALWPVNQDRRKLGLAAIAGGVRSGEHTSCARDARAAQLAAQGNHPPCSLPPSPQRETTSPPRTPRVRRATSITTLQQIAF